LYGYHARGIAWARQHGGFTNLICSTDVFLGKEQDMDMDMDMA
jgi:hypothetical protein